jgi:hypothetical protein
MAPQGRQAQDWFQVALLFLISLPLVIVRIKMLVSPLPMRDFVTYWAAGRLFVSGGDPYSMTATYAISRALGWAYTNQFVMLNPPWILLYVGPLARMPFEVAHAVNFGIDLILNLASSVALWFYFGGALRRWWIAVAVLMTYVPAALAEHYGQITPVVLAGLTVFLYSIRRQRYVLAGVCLLALGLKAHLLYLVLLAVLLWCIRERKWVVLTTTFLAAVGTTGVCVALNGNVLGYFHGTLGAALDTSCGVGGLLRNTFGVKHTWLQFVPCVVGLAWFVRYWQVHRHGWIWEERLPLLLLVSLSSSPYFWVHDFILGIPALIAVAVGLQSRSDWQVASLAYVLVQAIIPLAGYSFSCSACLLWIPFYWYFTSRHESAKLPHQLTPAVGTG